MVANPLDLPRPQKGDGLHPDPEIFSQVSRLHLLDFYGICVGKYTIVT